MGMPAAQRFATRVKSMEEHILEEPLRRSARKRSPVLPDLNITGAQAPVYRWRCERYQHLPEIRNISLQRYDDCSSPRQLLSRSNDLETETEDQDSTFAFSRVYQILEDEGFNSQIVSNDSDNVGSESKVEASKVHQLLHQTFMGQTQNGNSQSFASVRRAQSQYSQSFASVRRAQSQSSRRTTDQENNKYISATSKEILKVLKMKNKIPALRPVYFERRHNTLLRDVGKVSA